ncbi:MAG: hypothetical protein IJZ22_07775 [Bacteroidaceae bacterium]|nr:hypothetical protein [Bacteroidaceae bacterium]
MKASTLTTIQITSLALIIGCAEGALEDFLSSIVFILSFTAFAMCSIYIGRNEKRIIRDTNRRYSTKTVA